jgi:hypothetical protein
MIKSIVAIVIVAVSMVVGCVEPPVNHYIIHIDPNFSVADVYDALVAISDWETILDGALTTNVSMGECLGVDHETCIHASSGAYIATQFGVKNSTLAITEWPYSRDHADIWIALDRLETRGFGDVSDMRGTFLHELGHSMQLQHSESGSAMCWLINCEPADRLLTCSDVAQWRSIRGMSPFSKSCPHGGSFVLSGK